jgi:hypothetical protein
MWDSCEKVKEHKVVERELAWLHVMRFIIEAKLVKNLSFGVEQERLRTTFCLETTLRYIRERQHFATAKELLRHSKLLFSAVLEER